MVIFLVMLMSVYQSVLLKCTSRSIYIEMFSDVLSQKWVVRTSPFVEVDKDDGKAEVKPGGMLGIPRILGLQRLLVKIAKGFALVSSNMACWNVDHRNR